MAVWTAERESRWWLTVWKSRRQIAHMAPDHVRPYYERAMAAAMVEVVTWEAQKGWMNHDRN